MKEECCFTCNQPISRCMAGYVDHLIVKGCLKHEVLPIIAAEARSRGQAQFQTLGNLNAHIRFRCNTAGWRVEEDGDWVKLYR